MSYIAKFLSPKLRAVLYTAVPVSRGDSMKYFRLHLRQLLRDLSMATGYLVGITGRSQDMIKLKKCEHPFYVKIALTRSPLNRKEGQDEDLRCGYIHWRCCKV